MDITNNKKIRLLISFMIVALLVTTIPFVSVNASSGKVTTGNLTVKKVPTIDSVYEMYEGQSEDIKINKRSKNSLEYSISFKGVNGEIIKSEIKSIKNEKGDITLEIREGKNKDILTYMADGTICLDGEPVQIEEKITDDSIISFDKNFANAAQMMSWTSTCPYGSTNQYTKAHTTISKK